MTLTKLAPAGVPLSLRPMSAKVSTSAGPAAAQSVAGANVIVMCKTLRNPDVAYSAMPQAGLKCVCAGSGLCKFGIASNW